jgi:hypothetical protein
MLRAILWAVFFLRALPKAPRAHRPTILHRCSCGERYTPAAWLQLRDNGPMRAPQNDDGTSGDLRLRTCSRCGSTRSVPLEDDPPMSPAGDIARAS